MKTYRFTVKKIITNTIELKANNYKEALTKLLEFLELGDREIFEKTKDKKIDYDIILEKIRSKNDMKNLENIKEILTKIEQNDDEFRKKYIKYFHT